MNDLIVTPITIVLDRYDDPDCRAVMVKATSPQHPNLDGLGQHAVEAVISLMDEIVDATPLGDEVVQALRDAGHSAQTIQILDQCLVGDELRDYRVRPAALIEWLAKYADVGIPADLAIRFMQTILTLDEAVQVRSAGRSPEDVLEYVRWSATDKWWKWDFDCVEWMLAGIPAERCMLYAGCNSGEAAAWEPVVRENGVSDDDLRDILRAEFTLADFLKSVETYSDSDVTLADMARMALALKAPAPPAFSGWGSGVNYDEPPF